MPYAPGQTWDSTLSYSFGQTCVYNNLPYVYWHPTSNSTPGVTPVDEIKEFEAEDVNGAAPSETRSERAWVLADYFISTGIPGGAAFARYGNIKDFLKTIRHIDPAVLPPTVLWDIKYEGSIYLSFWSNQANLTERSWRFYGMEALSVQFGLANPSTVPPTPPSNGDSNVSVANIWESTTGPISYTRSMPKLNFVPATSTSGTLEVTFPIDPKDYAISYINEFGRTANYTIKVVLGGIPSDSYDINGSVSSGNYRDGFSLDSTSPKTTHSVSWLPTQGAAFSLKVNSITPPFAN